MINWRKPLIRAAFCMKGQPAFRYLNYLRSLEYKSPQELMQLQDEKLQELLVHACKNVPYYNRVLSQVEVVKGKCVKLENFYKIPVLTKDIIRREGENLYSRDYRHRRWYPNTTGGSTGEPVRFIQDNDYEALSFAVRFLYNSWAGKEIGEPELLLWGSERDVLLGTEKVSTRLRRWGFNMVLLNSFSMTDQIMADYVRRWNSLKPKTVWAYTGSIFEFGRYINRSGAKIFSPASIVCAAETLTEDTRQSIEEVFGCPALNQYGSRETAAVACECFKREGLHTFILSNKVEILDSNLDPCPPNRIGDVYVTTLNNYSMPLIRYRIGDMAMPAENQLCSCGRGWPLIANVVGRHIEVFKTREGRIIPGEFFIHFVGVVFNKNYIKKFQVLQKDYDHVVIRLVVIDNQKFDEFKPDIVDSIKKVMGHDCKVEFDYVDDIQPTKSGKYLYTVSEVS